MESSGKKKPRPRRSFKLESPPGTDRARLRDRFGRGSPAVGALLMAPVRRTAGTVVDYGWSRSESVALAGDLRAAAPRVADQTTVGGIDIDRSERVLLAVRERLRAGALRDELLGLLEVGCDLSDPF
jgi:hypothetical protein